MPGRTIGRFEPTPARTPAECEQYYATIHSRLGQDILLQQPNVLAYHTMRVVAELGVPGGETRPGAWRFVSIRFIGEPRLEVTREQDELLNRDGVNCLYRRRVCAVEERVVLHRVTAQTSMTKFLIEADRPADLDHAEASCAFSELADRLRLRIADALGVRLLIINRVLSEARAEPIEYEGQRVAGALPATTRVGYLECYFDHPRWGREALMPIVDSWMRCSEMCDVRFLEVEELTALDRR